MILTSRLLFAFLVSYLLISFQKSFSGSFIVVEHHGLELAPENTEDDSIVKIMPLGNSITFGNNNTNLQDPEDTARMKSYRQKLWQLLNQKGYPVDFVGSKQAGHNVTPAFDIDNAGFSAIEKGELLTLLKTGINPRDNKKETDGPYLDAFKPSIILLHIGTNAVNPSVSEINDILDEVDNYENRTGIMATVILAKIIKRLPRDANDPAPNNLEQYNANLEELAQERINDGDDIILVDMESGAGLIYEIGKDMADDLHPNESGFNKMAQAWFTALEDVFEEAPAAPSNLSATPVSQNEIQLNWEDNADNEDNFILESSASSGAGFTELATLNKNTTTFKHTGLIPNQTVFYRIKATNSILESNYSNETSATTFDTKPVAPSGLEATGLSATIIELTWNDNSDNEDNFVLESSATSGSGFTTLITLDKNITTYNHEGLNPNQTVFYRIKALNSEGESDYSNEGSATTLEIPPAAPTGLEVGDVSETSIQLTWTDNADNEANFVLESSSDSGNGFTELALVEKDITSFIHDGLGPEQTFFYRVKAVNSAGESDYSNEASGATIITGIEDYDFVHTINIFPNPVEKVIHITFDNDIKGKLVVRLINVLGSEMGFYELEKYIRKMEHSINIGNLRSGLYILEVTHNKFRFTQLVNKE